MAFGNIDSPPVTDFGAIRNPTGQGSCCAATRTLSVIILLDVTSLVVGSGFTGPKYCVDAHILGEVTWGKECKDVSGLDCSILPNKEFTVLSYPLNGWKDHMAFDWVYPGAGIGSGGIQTSRFDIIDVKVDWCGSCNPGTQGTYSSGDPSECDCSQEKEAFPPFTIKVCSSSCKDGWGSAIKRDVIGPVNDALKNLQVGGCACSKCEECIPYGKIPSNIKTGGRLMYEAISTLGGYARKHGHGGVIPWGTADKMKDMFDTEPDLCP